MYRPGILVGLVRFDMLRVRRSLESVLSRWQDRLTLALMLAFAALVAASAFETPPGAALRPLWAALAAGLVSALAAAAHARRIEALAARSIVAPLALSPGARAVHLATLSGALLALLLLAARAAGMAALFSASALALILAAWAGGALAGTGAARLWSWWRARVRPAPLATTAAADILAPPRRSGLLGMTLHGQLPLLPWRGAKAAFIACLALGFAQAAAAGAWAGALAPWAGRALVGAAALAALLALSRVLAGACRFGTFAGVATGHALAAHLAAPAAATLGGTAATLFFFRADPAWLWLQLAAGLVAALAVTARVLHYRLADKARADRLMQAELAVLLLAAGLAPPLALLLVAVRIGQLYRDSRRAVWTAA